MNLSKMIRVGDLVSFHEWYGIVHTITEDTCYCAWSTNLEDAERDFEKIKKLSIYAAKGFLGISFTDVSTKNLTIKKTCKITDWKKELGI